MNLSNNWHTSSGVRIPLFTALVYAYFCAPVSLEHKAFVQNATSSAPPIALADRPRVITFLSRWPIMSIKAGFRFHLR